LTSSGVHLPQVWTTSEVRLIPSAGGDRSIRRYHAVVSVGSPALIGEVCGGLLPSPARLPGAPALPEGFDCLGARDRPAGDKAKVVCACST
jgi:hypothetical protein